MAFSDNSRRRRRRNKLTLTFFIAGIGLGTIFGLYLWNLNRQVSVLFEHREQFLPTRIYSDISKISLSDVRSDIELKLKTLAYTHSSTDTTIQFHLHPVDYPPYLLPESHPVLDSPEPLITLTFDMMGREAPLRAIQIGSQNSQDLYLEPELVATLSRGPETKKEIRTYLTFEEIPALVWKAFIAIEDQHFLDHKGLDPRGIARALWINFKTFSLAQGGSTITQQLVKNLLARRTKNIFQKINETFLAFLLEAKYDKEQILERYLNEVYLGQIGSFEVHGVAEGAQHFFGKKLNDLNLGEIALMAGLIRGPGFYSPYRHKDRAIERQRLVLAKMVETGQIANDEAKAALAAKIRLSPAQTAAIKAPFFVDYVKAELNRLLKDRLSEQEITQAGFRVYTTLNVQLNQFAQDAVNTGVKNLQKRIKTNEPVRLEGALACVDQSKGYLRALIGGKDYAESNYNRILYTKRQVGSTFKPFVYLAAFEKGRDPHGIPYGPGYPLEDAPWTLAYDHGRQTWSPKNIEKGNLGWISLRTALIQSNNIATARLGAQVGIDQVIETARKLGIESYLPPVPSLALGVAELSPVELLRAYSTIANRGVSAQFKAIHGISYWDGTEYARYYYQSTPILDPAKADLLTDLLQDVFRNGTARSAQQWGFTRPAAGKTGTTNNYRDAWFVGFTPQLTTLVWVGMDQSVATVSEQLRFTGAGSALPIWVSFMKRALKYEATLNFPPNAHLVEIPIDRHTGNQASNGCPSQQVIVEKYIQGVEPNDSSCAEKWPPSTATTDLN